MTTTPIELPQPADPSSGRRGRFRSLSALPRDLILATTQNQRMVRVGQRWGMRLGAARFVAGETLDDCIPVLQRLAQRGIRTYTIPLGESVSDRSEVERVVRLYEQMVERLAHEPFDKTLSVKPTNLGLVLDEELAYENAVRILTAARAEGLFVRVEMEESRHVDATLRIYRRLREAGFDNTGVVLQAYLYRTEADLRELLPLDPNVRLVKGAYLEPAAVAFPKKADVDRNYCKLVDIALAGGGFTALATHDDAMIEHAIARLAGSPAAREGRYEFQLLFGVRSQLPDRLVERGHPVRVCVPYGRDWYVYFGRRLAERPANLLFVLKSMVRG
ncbi:proline dehydrogenase family protein [Conexibacter woesei]|uniref:proline dehydrogenase n=1 Tax=Conexibacter woesei (strain DSM 14684 / CCUG 47730 / CIP 108061 / JCM 11494 / NBRC 100937 / ID131577) TaxID=469383 RepID=D3F9D0_CONWI|nr:proline dehydrogenase family protein [Conexibacter woesei]ADB49097.1 Proline dehydrogenase [Conexibacter woesei DSM 14684]